MLKDKRVKAIYHYLCESCDNNDIKSLITLLKDYVSNGSFTDFEKEDSSIQEIIDSIYEILGF